MHLLGILSFTHIVSSAGYGAIFVLCVLQSCCVPTSSELTLGFAGALAAQGKLSMPGVIVAGVAGEVVGAYIAWIIGRYAGRAVVDRFGRYILLTHHDLDRAEAWYDRHERFGVFGSRLLPVIRNFVALPAGIAEVPLVRFGVLTAAGSLLWDGAWAGIGYGVGTHWHAIAKGVGDAGYVLAAIAVAAIALAAWHRYHSYKRETSEERTPAHRRRGEEAIGEVRWLSSSSGEPPVRQITVAPELRTTTDQPERDDHWVASSSGEPHPPPALRSDFPDSPIAAWEAAVMRGRTDVTGRGASRLERAGRAPEEGLLPLVGRVIPAPAAAKVPEVILLFWVVKILTTAGGEATSDYFKTFGNLKGGGLEVGIFVLALLVQFGTTRYRAFSYWFLAFAIAIFGTGVSDFLHLDVGIPYAGTTALWAVVLAVVFVVWHRSEGTLSIHSITTQRREGFYWATVFATFALGTALGDFTATSLHLGYLASGILFSVIILLPALAWQRFGLNSIAAFWMSYVVTRPLGASFADYISKPHGLSGIDFGDAPTAIVFAVAVFLLVCYLAVARPDIQDPLAAHAARRPVPSAAPALEVEPHLEVD